MKPIALLLAALILSAPAAGAESAWQEVAPDVSVRLVSSDVMTDENTVWMGLEIAMPADTKTYWRVPGESGIPLDMDISGAHGLADARIAWPYPERETRNGYVDHVYYGHVLIPFEVEVTADAAELVADIMLGICSDICVPASAGLTIAPDFSDPDNAAALRIRQALATVPLPHEGAAIFGGARFDENAKAIVVQVHDLSVPVESMIGEIAGSNMVLDVPHASKDGSAMVFPVLGRMDPELLENAKLRVTFDTPDGPFEITRAIGNH